MWLLKGDHSPNRVSNNEGVVFRFFEKVSDPEGTKQGELAQWLALNKNVKDNKEQQDKGDLLILAQHEQRDR